MKVPENRKMTFYEFVAYQETLDGTIDESWLEHWTKHISEMILDKNTQEHCGYCTDVPCLCNLCILESWLKEYREYYLEKC